jgi:hypothetical protein
MDRCSFFNRVRHFPITRLAAVMLVALALGTRALCSEIHEAAKNGDLEKVKALLKDNPDLAFNKDIDGATPLHYAASNGHKDLTAFLLASKADVNAKAKNGATPMHLATSNGHIEVIKLLWIAGLMSMPKTTRAQRRCTMRR